MQLPHNLTPNELQAQQMLQQQADTTLTLVCAQDQMPLNMTTSAYVGKPFASASFKLGQKEKSAGTFQAGVSP